MIRRVLRYATRVLAARSALANRVLLALRSIRRHVTGRAPPSLRGTGKEYWEERVRRYGRRSVLHIGYSEREYDELTSRQRAELLPHFTGCLRGDERLALDLGCGPGRFTADLARAIGGRAIGVDIIAELLAMAPRSAAVEYRLMPEGEIPLEDASVDVVWICVVLGGLSETTLARTVREIGRVLKDGGLLFVVENTSDKPSSRYWSFRRPEQYAALFPFAPLTPLHRYTDFGERFTVMAARKSS